MIKFGLWFTLLILFLNFTTAQAAVTLLDKDEWKVLLGGFAELDMFYDSTRSFTEVVGNGAISRPYSINGDNGRTQFSIRNSRFAFSVLPPVQNDIKGKGYLEFDLLGYDPSPSTAAPTNSESSFYANPTLRVRHAYMMVDTNDWQILAGQTWTLFGWDPVYVLTTASVPPVSGSVYERTPQITAIKTVKMNETTKLQAGLSISRPAQRDSSIPNLDGGVRLSMGSRRSGFASPSGDVSVEPFSVAVTGTARQFVTPASTSVTGGTTSFSGGAVAIDTLIPVLAASDDKDMSGSLTITGEFTTGLGYGDEFPSWSGNISQLPTTLATGATATTANLTNLDAGQGGFDSSGNFQLTKLQTWNAQLQYHLPSGCNSFVTAGYGQMYFINSGNFAVSSGTILYDRPDVAFMNIFHDLTKQIRMAVEYDRFSTHYVDGVLAQENRFQLSSWIRF